MKKLLVSLLASLLIFSFGCAKPATKPSKSKVSTGPTFVYQNIDVNPKTITITKGTTVTWDNQDSVTHTATADDNSFDSGNIEPGKKYTRVFSAPGTFNWHCSIHPSITGKVIVK